MPGTSEYNTGKLTRYASSKALLAVAYVSGRRRAKRLSKNITIIRVR